MREACRDHAAVAFRTQPGSLPGMAIVSGLRSPYELVDGLVYAGRMIDKVRLHRSGRLPADYHANLGKGFDARCCAFLGVDYATVVAESLARSDEDAGAVLARLYARGRRPWASDVALWNGYMTKRGWRDEAGATLGARLAEAGFAPDAAQTVFDLIELDEGRSARHLSL